MFFFTNEVDICLFHLNVIGFLKIDLNLIKISSIKNQCFVNFVKNNDEDVW